MPDRTGWPKVWRAYLACGAVVAAAYYLIPATDLAPRWAAKIGLTTGSGCRRWRRSWSGCAGTGPSGR
jgi:hypothetical protein